MYAACKSHVMNHFFFFVQMTDSFNVNILNYQSLLTRFLLTNRMHIFLTELIGTPSAPALVADSLTATSLSLTWEPRNLANMSYLVQWRYEELSGSWQYYSNTSHSDRSIIHVENLRPYTKYRVSFEYYF